MKHLSSKNNMKKKPGLPAEASAKAGYTLLFAMIVASIVLALGVSLLTVSRKEFILSSSATQSSKAFYAADSGIGCAEYWDGTNGGQQFSGSTVKGNIQCAYVVPSSGPAYGVSVTPALSSNITQALPFTPTNNDSNNDYPTYEYTFSTPFSTDGTTNLSCAQVYVDKYYAPNPNLNNANYQYTTITSWGYNLGWEGNAQSQPATGDCLAASPKKVNRTFQLTY